MCVLQVGYCFENVLFYVLLVLLLDPLGRRWRGGGAAGGRGRGWARIHVDQPVFQGLGLQIRVKHVFVLNPVGPHDM